MGQYGATGQNQVVDGGRIACGPATTDKHAIGRVFGTTKKPSETVMLLSEAFPVRGTSPARRGLPRP